MTYHVVFDAATADFRGFQFFVGIGLVLTAAGAGLAFAPALMRWLMPGGIPSRSFSWFFFLFALAWTIVAGSGTFYSYWAMRDASVNHTCTLVTGVVSNFVPMPYSGHALERFTVGGVRFEYSDYEITGGFNQTASHGGPIRADLPVRICYVRYPTSGRNIIVRLEVASYRARRAD